MIGVGEHFLEHVAGAIDPSRTCQRFDMVIRLSLSFCCGCQHWLDQPGSGMDGRREFLSSP
jgi:hypothetical protein